MFESLEPRQLLSVLLHKGTLFIVGTRGNDHLAIDRGRSVDQRPGTTLVVRLNGQVSSFSRSSVKRIAVATRNGDDRITIAPNLGNHAHATAEVAIDAGPGNDRVLGGAGADSVLGGPGNDTLCGFEGDDFLDGAEGKDRLEPGPGADSLEGGDGRDVALMPPYKRGQSRATLRNVERKITQKPTTDPVDPAPEPEPPPPPPPGDSLENDNTASKANPFALDGTLQDHTLHVPTDVDWVKFTLTETTSLLISSTVATLKLGLYGPDRASRVIVADDGPKQARIDRRGADSLAPGTYFIKVEPTANTITKKHYSLFAVAGAAGQDLYEPDGYAEDSTVLPINAPVQIRTLDHAGDIDWIRFTFPTAVEATIELTGVTTQAQVTLYGRNRADLYVDADNGESDDRILLDRTGANYLDRGTYFLRVERHGLDTGPVSYGVRVTSKELIVPTGPIREIEQFAAPGSVEQMAYSSEHGLLFLRNSGNAIRVVDTLTHQTISIRAPRAQFNDMALTPDGRYLFAADFGGEHNGSGTPASPNYVHRFDLLTREWESPRVVPNAVAYAIEAVSADRFLVISSNQFVDIVLGQWDDDGDISVLYTASGGYVGWFGYDDAVGYDWRSGYLFLSERGSSDNDFKIYQVIGDAIAPVRTDRGQGGGSVSISVNGAYAHHRGLRFDLTDINAQPTPTNVGGVTSNTVGFGWRGYYSTEEAGTPLGYLGFDSSLAAMSADGKQVVVYDPAKGILHRYELLV